MRSVGGGDQKSGLERIMELSLRLIVLCFENEKRNQSMMFSCCGPHLFYLVFSNLLTNNCRKQMEKRQ